MKGLIVTLFISCNVLIGQILCIKCFDQNDSISSGVHNLVLNGGFENGCPGGGNFCPIDSLNYTCDIANWICTGGGQSTYAYIIQAPTFINSIIVEGTKAAYFGNGFSKICSKKQNDINCLINSDCIITNIPDGYPTSDIDFGKQDGVSLQQNISNLIPGNPFVLEFWAGGEYYQKLFPHSGIFAVDIGFGKIFLKNNPTNTRNGIGIRYLIEFKATSSIHTIKFTNWGHMCDSCTELVLDDVRLYTLDELPKSIEHCVTEVNNTNEQLQITLSPNPFNNELQIKSIENSELTIYDLTLKKIVQQKIASIDKINTEALTRGMYFYCIRNKNEIKSGKILKQ